VILTVIYADRGEDETPQEDEAREGLAGEEN
jgi:hypothetical protein